MKPKNIKAAKELVKLYRSLTIKEIDEASNSVINDGYAVNFYPSKIANRLTGYGDFNCSLCVALREPNTMESDCSLCIHNIDDQSQRDGMYCLRDRTYMAIQRSENSEEFLRAFSERADYIEGIIKSWG